MLKIVFTSEDNENSMFGIEEFPISAEHASQLMRGDMSIERFLDDNLNAPNDISRLKGLLLEGNAIDHVTVAIKFESGADIKEAIQKHLANNDIWESLYDTLVSSKDSITLETIKMLHSNIDAFYKQEVTGEVKPFKKKKPYPRD
nr:MAG: hypothetical protein [Bacteriophage sp.]